MDCSDGSLCRITSSAKEVSNPFLVFKVPDKESDFPFKLIPVGVDINEHEPSSPSDKSEEEDEETKKFELYLKNFEETKKPDSDKITETSNNTNKEPLSDSSHKKQHFRESRGNKYSRSNRKRRVYNASQGGRNYNGSDSGGKYQNSSSNSSARLNINPWITPPLHIGNMQAGFQFSAVSHYANALDPLIQTNANCEVKSACVGLLGNSPFSPAPSHFHSSDQDMYDPGSLRFHSSEQDNVFDPGHKYWKNDYNEYHSSDYQRSAPPGNSTNYQRSAILNRPVSGRQDHRSNFRNERKFWGKKSEKKFGGWNRNRNEKGREKNTSSYYNYEYRKK